MRAALCNWFLLAVMAPASLHAQLALDIVYPREGQVVTAVDSTFVFGAANSADAQIFVNDQPVKLNLNGAFLTMVPVTSGEFTFRCRAVTPSDTIAVVRNVFIPPSLTTTAPFAIDTSYIFPKDDLELSAGDYVQVSVKGTPGLFATFTIPGLVEKAPMAEGAPINEAHWGNAPMLRGSAVFGDDGHYPKPAVAGIYRGIYKIPDGLELTGARIDFELNGTDGVYLNATAPGKLTVRKQLIPQIAELTEEWTIARTGPGLGPQLFLPAGVKLAITGKHGRFYRARLTETEHAWVPESDVKLLSPGTPIPFSVIKLVSAEEWERKVGVKIFMQERLPFKIEQSLNPPELVITIYGATADTDWMRYDSGDRLIRQLSWSQPRDGVYQLVIQFNEQQSWGYNSYYENENLIIDIKKPPRKLELKELLICLDPGHGPEDGAVGPTRFAEQDANLQLARAVQAKLERKGARVFLTRDDRHGVNLSVRPKLAEFVEADLLISIHHNALPDGVNPLVNRGASTYYYHPQSLLLAQAIQKRMLETLRQPDFGLYYDNLALCRPTQMPAVMIEPAFITHPEQEQLIKSASYQRAAAEAVVKGIEDFLKETRKK